MNSYDYDCTIDVPPWTIDDYALPDVEGEIWEVDHVGE